MKIRRWLPLLALLVLSVSCAAVNLREAQDAFNDGALAEARQRETGLVGDAGLSGHVSALTEYQSARILVTRVIDDKESDLRDNQLLGTAYVLKALCLWRIDDLASLGDPPSPGTSEDGDELGALLAEINAATTAKPPIVLGTRDQVLVEALPGLRDHDRGLRATQLDGDTGAEAYFKSALTTLTAALQDVNPPANHPIRTYVELAQLSTLRAWQSAAYRFKETTREAVLYLGEKKVIDQAKEIIAKIEEDKGAKELVRKLKASLGIS